MIGEGTEIPGSGGVGGSAVGGRGGTAGVTGHRGRPLPGADLPLLEERVDGVLAGLAHLEFQALVSPLAEGADRVVARRALAAEWALRVLLPFPAVRYEEDFHGDGSVDEFRGLLARAAAVEVVRPEDAAPSSPDADLPYRRVGLALLDRVQVLVALWDGQAPRGPGGTGEVVEEAVRRGIPVLWIHATAPHPVRLMEPGVPGARAVDGAIPEAVASLLGRWLGAGAP